MSRALENIRTNQLRRYRKKRYLRQRDVSDRMGLKQASDIHRWEKGVKMPSLINALKLSAALKCPVELLYSDHYKQIQKDMYGSPPDETRRI